MAEWRSYLTHLECTACGAVHDADHPQTVCSTCGKVGWPRRKTSCPGRRRCTAAWPATPRHRRDGYVNHPRCTKRSDLISTLVSAQ